MIPSNVPFEICLLKLETIGDAITVRHHTPNGKHVTVIDGGKASGAEILEKHLSNDYRTERINLMICTHCDEDHIEGLRKLIEDYNFQVDEVWVHDVDAHQGVHKTADLIMASVQQNKKFVKLLDQKGIKRKEPFTGVTDDNGFFTVIGPDVEHYEDLMSEKKVADYMAERRRGELLTKAARELKEEQYIPGSLEGEDDDPSPSNNSSAIIRMDSENHGSFLFTGDAGKETLRKALILSQTRDIHWLKVPHHGSTWVQ